MIIEFIISRIFIVIPLSLENVFSQDAFLNERFFFSDSVIHFLPISILLGCIAIQSVP